MRLIDADALKKVIYFETNHLGIDFHKSKLIGIAIDNAPTIDAVRVVRCKDCKYYEGKNTYCANDRLATPDDYCSIGERREE